MEQIKIISIFLLISGHHFVHSARNEFIQQPDQTKNQPSRQQLRENLVRIFDEYAHTLLMEIESLTILLELSSHTPEIITSLEQRISALEPLASFFEKGLVSEKTRAISAPQRTAISLIGSLIKLLTTTERCVLNAVRNILEESSSCCFATTRSKSQLQEYYKQVNSFLQASHDHVKKIQKHYTKITISTTNGPSNKEQHNGII